MLKTFAFIAIDQIQDGKKQFVNTFVRNESLANILNTFVDTQAAYTQAATNAAIDSFTSLTKFVTSPESYKVSV